MYSSELLPKYHYMQNESVILKSSKSYSHQLDTESDRKHICLDFFKMNYIAAIFFGSPLVIRLVSMLYLIKDFLNFGAKHYIHFVGYFAQNIINPTGLAGQYINFINFSQASIAAGE